MQMPETSNLRDRKKQRTRQTIERVALDLFEVHGYDGTTINQIAVAADIAPRTFFHYFPSKEDVVLADYATRLEQIVAALRASQTDQPPWQALRSAFMSVAADYETEREHLLRRFRIIQATPSVAARNLQIQATWEDTVAEAVSRWLDLDGVGDIRPRLIAGAALAAMRASLRHWLTDNGNSRLPDHMAYCFDLMATGLGRVNRPT
jgi:AcrR family transcriptional regulator